MPVSFWFNVRDDLNNMSWNDMSCLFYCFFTLFFIPTHISTSRTDTGINECTGSVPMSWVSKITNNLKNSWHPITLLVCMGPNRSGHMGHAMRVQFPLCNISPTDESGIGSHILPHSRWDWNQSRIWFGCIAYSKTTNKCRLIIYLIQSVFVDCPCFAMVRQMAIHGEDLYSKTITTCSGTTIYHDI